MNEVLTGVGKPVGTDEYHDSSSMILVPNPALNFVNVSSSLLAQNWSQLTIQDVNGRQVMTQRINQFNSAVDISQLFDGVYFVTLQAGKQTLKRKLVKM
jgi:Secretion system C-terminal sorting domain